MSLDVIKSVLEKRLAALPNGIPTKQTQWPNTELKPAQGVPYQRVWHIPAPPFNFSGLSSRKRLAGVFQVDLCFPFGTGEAAADAAAKALEGWFPQGWTETANNVTTHVDRTPEIKSGRVEGDRWVIPVRVTWYCNT